MNRRRGREIHSARIISGGYPYICPPGLKVIGSRSSSSSVKPCNRRPQAPRNETRRLPASRRSLLHPSVLGHPARYVDRVERDSIGTVGPGRITCPTMRAFRSECNRHSLLRRSDLRNIDRLFHRQEADLASRNRGRSLRILVRGGRELLPVSHLISYSVARALALFPFCVWKRKFKPSRSSVMAA